MGADTLNPLGFDSGEPTRVQTRCVDQLGGHQPLGALFRSRRRMGPKPDRMRPEVMSFIAGLVADITQQTRKQGLVKRLVGSRNRVLLPTEIGDRSLQLLVDIDPFTYPTRVQKLRAQHLLALALTETAISQTLNPVPKLDPTDKIATLICEWLLRFIGRLCRLGRALTGVLHRQCTGNNQDLAQGPSRTTAQKHPGDPRIQRQTREGAARVGQATLVIERPQLKQQRLTIDDRPPWRCIQEWEGFNCVDPVCKAQRHHSQDDASERGAKNFGIGEGRASLELVGSIKTHANTIGNSATATRALIGRRSRDALDLQLLDLAAITIAFDTRLPRINHIANSWDRHRGFCHVGGQHDSSPMAPIRTKDFHLVAGGQPREQGQYLHRLALRRRARWMPAKVGLDLANLALTGQEHQHITRALAPDFVNCLTNRFGQFNRILVSYDLRWTPPDLDREQSPRNLNHRGRLARRTKMRRKSLRVDRCRSDDEPKIITTFNKAFEVSEQEVDVQTAFMRLIDDDRVVFA